MTAERRSSLARRNHSHAHSHRSGVPGAQFDRDTRPANTMSDRAYSVPSDEEPACVPVFSTGGLTGASGWLEWVPELVLGLELDGVGTAPFSTELARRQRRLQATYHPDRRSGDGNLSR